MGRFKLKRWTITVAGWGTATALASTRGKALAGAWRSDAFAHISFSDFLKIARCRRDPVALPRFGDSITVDGKPAYFVSEDGQYVHFAWPDGDFPLISHPLDVLPQAYRPRAYRQEAA